MPPPKQFAQKLELFLLHRTEWRWKQFRSQNVRRLCQILRDLGLKFIQHSSLPMFTVQLQAAICALLYSEVCHFSFEKCPWKLRTFMNEGFNLLWFGNSELVSCRWSLGNAGRRRRRRRRTWNKDSSAFFSRVNPTTRTQSIRLQIQMLKIWPNHVNNIYGNKLCLSGNQISRYSIRIFRIRMAVSNFEAMWEIFRTAERIFFSRHRDPDQATSPNNVAMKWVSRNPKPKASLKIRTLVAGA